MAADMPVGPAPTTITSYWEAFNLTIGNLICFSNHFPVSVTTVSRLNRTSLAYFEFYAKINLVVIDFYAFLM
jgi:hypothetical protein